MIFLILGILLLLLGRYINRSYRFLPDFPGPKGCLVMILNLTGFAFVVIFIIKLIKRLIMWL